MIITSLKHELRDALIDALPEYADCIFSDDDGEVLRWAESGDDSRTIADSLDVNGLAIAVCGCTKRENIDAAYKTFVRRATFQVLVIGNVETLQFGDKKREDITAEVELVIMDLPKKASGEYWQIGNTETDVSLQTDAITVAHNYKKGK